MSQLKKPLPEFLTKRMDRAIDEYMKRWDRPYPHIQGHDTIAVWAHNDHLYAGPYYLIRRVTGDYYLKDYQL